jgi:hypothetical protein
MIDGLSSREERMRQYWARVDEDIKEINKKTESERQRTLTGSD